MAISPEKPDACCKLVREVENPSNDSTNCIPILSETKSSDADALIAFHGLDDPGKEDAEQVAKKVREYAEVLFECFLKWRQRK